MEVHAAQCIIELRLEPRAVVASVVAAFPDAFGAEAAFALTAVAVGLEQPVLHSRAHFAAQRQGLYRCIALLAADMCAVEILSGQRCSCGAILRYWQQSGETFFVLDPGVGQTTAGSTQL